jgi:hypothetical protein
MKDPKSLESRAISAYINADLSLEAKKALFLCSGKMLTRGPPSEPYPRTAEAPHLRSLLKALALSVEGINKARIYAGPCQPMLAFWLGFKNLVFHMGNDRYYPPKRISLNKIKNRRDGRFDYYLHLSLATRDRDGNKVDPRGLRTAFFASRSIWGGGTTVEALRAMLRGQTTGIKHRGHGVSLFSTGSNKKIAEVRLPPPDLFIRWRSRL